MLLFQVLTDRTLNMRNNFLFFFYLRLTCLWFLLTFIISITVLLLWQGTFIFKFIIGISANRWHHEIQCRIYILLFILAIICLIIKYFIFVQVIYIIWVIYEWTLIEFLVSRKSVNQWGFRLSSLFKHIVLLNELIVVIYIV